MDMYEAYHSERILAFQLRHDVPRPIDHTLAARLVGQHTATFIYRILLGALITVILCIISVIFKNWLNKPLRRVVLGHKRRVSGYTTDPNEPSVLARIKATLRQLTYFAIGLLFGGLYDWIILRWRPLVDFVEDERHARQIQAWYDDLRYHRYRWWFRNNVWRHLTLLNTILFLVATWILLEKITVTGSDLKATSERHEAPVSYSPQWAAITREWESSSSYYWPEEVNEADVIIDRIQSAEWHEEVGAFQSTDQPGIATSSDHQQGPESSLSTEPTVQRPQGPTASSQSPYRAEEQSFDQLQETTPTFDAAEAPTDASEPNSTDEKWLADDQSIVWYCEKCRQEHCCEAH